VGTVGILGIYAEEDVKGVGLREIIVQEQP
jgi:hypothetical protein